MQLQLEEHNLLLVLQLHLLVAHYPEHSGKAGLVNLLNRIVMIESLLSVGFHF